MIFTKVGTKVFLHLSDIFSILKLIGNKKTEVLFSLFYGESRVVLRGELAQQRGQLSHEWGELVLRTGCTGLIEGGGGVLSSELSICINSQKCLTL